MTFVNPAWLLLALAAAVPIVLHLLRRRIGNRVELPTARYLARAEAEHSRELRLRNVALMLLRAAAIVLVALAAARPFAALPGGARAAGSLAIVLDNTLSTAAVAGGTPVIEQLREVARVPLQRLRPEDKAWLVTADAVILGGTRDELLARLDSIGAIPARGNLTRALVLASEAVQGSGLPGEIALLTDAQATQWRESISLSGTRLVLFTPVQPPPSNRAVVEARPEPLRWSGGSGAVNVAFLSSDSALYRVSVSGGAPVRGVAEPDGRVRVPLATSARGWVEGTVETERDELPLDDTRHFAAFAGAVPAVTVRPDAGGFLETAVATLVDRGRLLRGEGAEVSSADAARRLPALLLAPSDPIRIGAANRALERLNVPWRFGEAVADSALARADSAAFLGMRPPRVTRRYRLVSAGEVDVRADTLAHAGGDPWIVAGVGYVLIGSPMDPAYTSLPVSAAFVPWLERTLAHRLTLDAVGVIEVQTGDTAGLPAWADALESSGGPAKSTVFHAPAVHFMTRGGTRVGAVVVNAPRSESLLERISPQALRGRFQGATVVVAGDARSMDRALLGTRGRTELTRWLLGLVAALLIAELLVRSSWRPWRARA